MSTQFKCPACGQTTNASNVPFVDVWAVACHMAGKFGGRDRLHRAWAHKYAPDADLSRRGWGLADELLLPISEVLNAQGVTKQQAAIPPSLSVIDELQQIERQLHSHIKRRLQELYSSKDETWWVEGIPLSIRQECAQRREGDKVRDELFSYTYLLDLKTIIDKNWSVFEPDFARIRSVVNSKKEFLDQVALLNEIRNVYYHPVRTLDSDSKSSRDSRDFVSDFAQIVSTFSNRD
jgi:hypothetical protein